MKIEWLVTNATAIGSPDRAELAIFGVILVERKNRVAGYQCKSSWIPWQSGTWYFGGDFCLFVLVNLGRICGGGAILWCKNPLLSNKSLLRVIQVTAAWSPDKVEHAISGVILAGLFLPIQAAFVGREPVCDIGSPSLALIILLRVI